MAKRGRKRRGREKDASDSGDQRQDGKFQVRPFKELKKLKKILDEELSPAPAPPPTPPPIEELEPENSKLKSEAEVLAEAMADVVPLRHPNRVAPVKQVNSSPPPPDETALVEAYLRDLVEGVVPFDIADTNEYIEGSVQGLDRRLIRKLRRGEYSIQSYRDLHGLNREEARSSVARFIKVSHERGLRCVLIVHGRGLRSKGQIPVLKEKLKAWLTRGSIGTKVLAFTSARPYDGGTGAVYVLLRK